MPKEKTYAAARPHGKNPATLGKLRGRGQTRLRPVQVVRGKGNLFWGGGVTRGLWKTQYKFWGRVKFGVRRFRKGSRIPAREVPPKFCQDPKGKRNGWVTGAKKTTVGGGTN